MTTLLPEVPGTRPVGFSEEIGPVKPPFTALVFARAGHVSGQHCSSSNSNSRDRHCYVQASIAAVAVFLFPFAMPIYFLT